MGKEAQLNKLADQIVGQGVCADLAKTATNLVFGAGNPDADIVFVGEAPGKKEDESGLPFVGAAGKFLDEMLVTIGLGRDEVYITNIVKYRPPNNRDPFPGEKEAFMPYLMQQIEIIKPQLIVTLGRHSLNVFLPSLRIGQVHGRPQQYNGKCLLPLYHPAAALYNGSLRQTLLSDFADIPQLLKLIQNESN